MSTYTLADPEVTTSQPVTTWRSKILSDDLEIGWLDWCVVDLCTYALRMELAEEFRGRGLLEEIVRDIEPQLAQTPVLLWYNVGDAFAAVWDRLSTTPRTYGVAVSGLRYTYIPPEQAGA